MSLEDLIDNIGTQNFAKANGVFDDLMKSKMSDALDAEQIRLANTVFNGGPEDDDDIKQMKKEIEAEKAAGEYDDMMGMGQDGPGGPGPQDQQPPDNAGAPGAITGNPSEPVEAAIPKKAKSNNGVKK